MDIALTVGGSVLSSFLQVLFDRMATPEFLNLFREQKFDDRILEKLKWKLLILQAVLEDAENKQSKNLAVKTWLDELQGVVYQADDLLDQIYTEALRVKVEREFQGPTHQVSSSTNPSNFSVEFLKEIVPKLEDIVQKLEDFEQKIGILGLLKEVESKKGAFQRPLIALLDEKDVYGRDDDVEKIIQALLSDVANREKFSVISIVGSGGVGKTTLAQFVCNDEKVKKQFDVKALVCISEEYDAIRITKLLLHELNMSSNSDSNESFISLQVKLKEGLSKKKFLLVLDDVWNRNYNDWLALSEPFKYGEVGSSIVVTTRDEKVALMMGARYIHHLNMMLEEDCWCLFKKHALNNRDAAANLEFESTGREIVKKCRGLPLAVKAVAGLLRSKDTIEEWNEILRSDEWEQTNNEAGILPSLRLSYNHLSSHLKRCFAYCAVFHKDYPFSKDEVILLWMANDLLEDSKSNKRLEDVGGEYFRELTFRSLFHKSNDGKFSMHDLVNDLAKSVAGKDFLRLEVNQRHKNSSFAVRHFSYLSSDRDIFEKFKPLNESKFLRTFLPLDFHGIGFYGANMLSHKLLFDILPAFKSLRVLSLWGYRIKELPNTFSNLKQLRLLNLSETRIKILPSWICTFYNLQTLLLVDCDCLEEFPEDMKKLINLRYLDVRGVPLTKMPIEIRSLKNLQFLSTFVVSKSSGSSIKELGKLSNLHGEFTIFGLENVADCKNASMAKMKGKKCIKKLTLNWDGDSNDSQVARDVLENLQPHSEIERLVIKGYCGTRFPNWLENASFCHMVSFSISNCEHCYCLPAIGQLPCLKYLTISGLSNISVMGQEIYGKTSVSKPFPCLKRLRIENMCEWTEWHIPENGVFSCLEVLRIINCPKLIGETPKQISSLRFLEIRGCPGLVNSDGGLTIFDSKADLLEFCSLRTLRILRMPNLKEPFSSSDLNELLPSLEKLVIENCQHIVSFPINRLPTTLKHLRVCGCENLDMETRGITCHVSIERLDIERSPHYVKKNLSLGSFPNLQHLFIWRVSSIEEVSITQENQNLTSLQSLEIRNCENFMSFPVGGLPAPNLTQIGLHDCPKLKSLPERMHTLLPSLRGLHLENCPEIECFPEGGLPSSLQSLAIANCEKLWSCRREWGLQRLPSLGDFGFCDTPKEEILLPEDLLLPCTLRSLSLGSLLHLKTFNYGILQHITCLESLYIRDCPMLQSLTEEDLPGSLSTLTIVKCPLLKQHLEWEKGEYWPKVAHIPCIQVDDELFP